MGALNYVYNRSAANLRGADVGLIGLVINDLRNPFFTEFAASAQMTFASRGYATVIANTDENPEIQAQVIASMIEHGVSGFLISPTYVDEALGARARPPGRHPDDAGAAPDRRPHRDLSLCLARLRRRRTARRRAPDPISARAASPSSADWRDRPVTTERMEGYLAVMAEAGLEPVAFHGRPSRAFGRDMALRLAAEHPDIEAAICFSDLVALGMLAGFAQAGVRVGTDFRLVGFDDIEECALTWPQLTSVRCDVALFGRESAEAMLAWLEDGERPPETRLAPVELIPRQSSIGF